MSSNTTINNLKSIIVDKNKEFENTKLEYIGYRDIYIDMFIDSMEINLITLREALQLIEDESADVSDVSDVNMIILISMYHKKKSESKLLEFAIKFIEKKRNRSDSIIRDLELLIVDHVDMLIGSMDTELISLRQSLQVIKAEVTKTKPDKTLQTVESNEAEIADINFITLINIYHKKTSEMRSLDFAIKCINKITNEIDPDELSKELA